MMPRGQARVQTSLAVLVLSAAHMSAAGGAKTALCGLDGSIVHTDPKKTVIRVATSGTSSLFFKSDLDVNTDGSSRSYHPQDPRGKTVALNNVGNAIEQIFDAAGNNINCKPRKGACFERFINTFEAARDADWAPSGYPRITTDGMIPWKEQGGRPKPCLIRSGPNTGFFVSQTSLIVDRSKPECDQNRYIDSLTFNAIVLPKYTHWASQEKVLAEGDLVAVRNLGNGDIAFAVVGDRGNENSLGEGTVRLAAQLRRKTLAGNENYEQVKALKLSAVEVVGFPQTDLRDSLGKFTQADIDSHGRRAFEAWGGVARLAACSGARNKGGARHAP
jgi:hypothetical protein